MSEVQGSKRLKAQSNSTADIWGSAPLSHSAKRLSPLSTVSLTQWPANPALSLPLFLSVGQSVRPFIRLPLGLSRFFSHTHLPKFMHSLEVLSIWILDIGLTKPFIWLSMVAFALLYFFNYKNIIYILH